MHDPNVTPFESIHREINSLNAEARCADLAYQLQSEIKAIPIILDNPTVNLSDDQWAAIEFIIKGVRKGLTHISDYCETVDAYHYHVDRQKAPVSLQETL